ncbi:ASCH domain-containing protein [Streptomyces caniscabiei]|uniref:ASCH domain-containing protein n=1 Tax=Streptomyces caniscabiei TaxID=2746961 RepID=UPI000765B7BD|nr:ASCH domain-containing protein [Streptomyces caniscabiei]
MSTTSARVIELNLYPQYFDLVAVGRKTREVRVKYPKFEGLAAGDLIRFSVKNTDRSCLTRVTRVAEYASFEDLLDTEGPSQVNPEATREEQIVNIRRIYGPEKERLGCLAIGIELVD